jgi:hypothetical protein
MGDWFSGVLQGIFGTLLYETLLAGGVAALIVFLKARKEKWAGPVMYGLSAFALVFVIGFTMTGHSPLSRQSTETTSENIESHIRTWADHFGLGVTRKDPPTDPPSEFLYLITTPNNRSILIGRIKKTANYVTVEAVCSPTQSQLDSISKLNPEQREQIKQQVILELSNLRIQFNLSQGTPTPLTRITLTTVIPITADFTEATFVGTILDMEHAILVCQTGIPLAIEQVTEH